MTDELEARVTRLENLTDTLKSNCEEFKQERQELEETFFEVQLEDLEERLDVVEEKQESIVKGIDVLDGKIRPVEGRLDGARTSDEILGLGRLDRA